MKTEEEKKQARKEQRRKRDEKYRREMDKNLYHFSIPTTKRGIKSCCSFTPHIELNLQQIIYDGPKHPDYRVRLAVFAWQMYFLYQMTYLGKDGNYKKPTSKWYAREIFLNWAESPEEMRSFFSSPEECERGFRIYKAICDCLCPMIAHYKTSERFWPEHVAFLVDYIISHDGNVPPPKFKPWFPYPENYPTPWSRENKTYILPDEIQIW